MTHLRRVPEQSNLYAKVARRFKITEAQCQELCRAMSATWDAIASDAAESATGATLRKINNGDPAIVAELTLDAGRYKTYGGQPLEWLKTFTGDLLALGRAVWKA